MGKNTCVSATLWDNNNNVLEQNQMINDHNSSEIGGVKKNYVPFKLLGFGVCFQWMIVSSFGEDRCKKLEKKGLLFGTFSIKNRCKSKYDIHQELKNPFSILLT